jgi:hypothetical protein
MFCSIENYLPLAALNSNELVRIGVGLHANILVPSERHTTNWLCGPVKSLSGE